MSEPVNLATAVEFHDEIARLHGEIERLRLTDAEREAVEWCLEIAVLHATECDEEIATLRGLLERHVAERQR